MYSEAQNNSRKYSTVFFIVWLALHWGVDDKNARSVAYREFQALQYNHNVMEVTVKCKVRPSIHFVLEEGRR